MTSRSRSRSPSKTNSIYRKQGPRGSQRGQLELEAKRGGGDDWLKQSLLPDVVFHSEAAVRDMQKHVLDCGTRSEVHAMCVTLSTANRAMEDIRQPFDNPLMDEEAKVLAKEIARYKEIAGDRQQRAAEIEASRPRLHIRLRLLSGEVLHGKAIIIPKNYEELQQAFVQAFPWHRTPVVIEYPDGRAVHPQTVHLKPGNIIHFRELAAPTDDLPAELQRLPAGWLRETYRRELLELPTTLIGGEKNMNPNHRHHAQRHHQHHQYHHHHHSH